jgi:hypothetical protein
MRTFKGVVSYEDRAYLVRCEPRCPSPDGWVPFVRPDGRRALALIGCGHSADEWVSVDVTLESEAP